MAANNRRPQMKLNRELKKAVHRGNGYEHYITLYQWQQTKLSLLQDRLAEVRSEIESFYADGGEVVSKTPLLYELSLQGVDVQIGYDEDGDVIGYSVTGMKHKGNTVDRILEIFFALYMVPKYEASIEKTREQLADIDNDSVLRGISEIRDKIRGDPYMTLASVSGLQISEEGDDPFELGGDRE